MRNLTPLLIVCALSTSFANAQIKKGYLFWGASIGATTYSSVTNDYSYIDGHNRTTNTKTFGLILNPSLGIFVMDHLILGGMLGLNYSHVKTNINATEGGVSASVTTSVNYTVNVGPFLRYYFYERLLSKNLLYLQVQGTVGTGNGNSTGSGFNSYSTYTLSGTVNNIFTYSGGGSVGVTHFISRDHILGLDISLGYLHSYVKSTNVNDTYIITSSTGNKTTAANNYGLATNADGFTLGVGFHWFISTKNKN